MLRVQDVALLSVVLKSVVVESFVGTKIRGYKISDTKCLGYKMSVIHVRLHQIEKNWKTEKYRKFSTTPVDFMH